MNHYPISKSLFSLSCPGLLSLKFSTASALTMSSHFFGDLYLPDPQIFLNREQLQALRSIQMSLDQFSQRLQSTALTTCSTNARPPTPISSDTSTPYEATYDKEMTDDENRQGE